MIKVAIIEDEHFYRQDLVKALDRLQSELKIQLKYLFYKNGLEILNDYPTDLDIIFMDIMMPGLDGMKTAKYIRKNDDVVEIIFLTNMVQYAIESYEVNAIDYILKPLVYDEFKIKLRKVLNKIELKNSQFIAISYNNEHHKVYIKDIIYVEIIDHKLIFHLFDRDVIARGTMKKLETQLQEYGFYRCDSCFLVNLNHVKAVEKDVVLIGNKRLHISRARKKNFINTFTQYLSKY